MCPASLIPLFVQALEPLEVAGQRRDAADVVRRDNEHPSLRRKRPGAGYAVVVRFVAHAYPLRRRRAGAGEQAGDEAVLARLPELIDGPREDQHDPVAAVGKRLVHGHRIADAAVEVRFAVDDIGPAEQRQRAGGLEHVVAVLREERFVEVERIARGDLARADIELGGAFSSVSKSIGFSPSLLESVP